MIKKIFVILGIALLGALFYLAYLNRIVSTDLIYFKEILHCNVSVLILSVALVSIFATAMLSSGNILDLEQKIKKQSRKNEKAGIIKEEAEDKIKLLEAKIQTLEKALSDCLKKD